MVERRLVVDHLKLNYEGLVNIHDLQQLIEDWLKQKGFDRREVLNQEIIQPEGKHIHVILAPWKRVSDYANHSIKIDMKMLGVKNVRVKVDGKLRKVQKGTVRITFDAYLDTEYEGKWQAKPLAYFIKIVMDKFIYRQYSEESEELLVENVTQLHHMLRAFLNMHKQNFGIMHRPELYRT